jgi:uncharacterized protein YndB with AHSA1/START domain
VSEPFRFDQRWAFSTSPEQFWATVSQTDRYPEWWGWLREFDADGLHEGATARCVIQAPLPYALRLTIQVERVEPGRSLDARISGDLRGPASLAVAPTPVGCEARLRWSLELQDRWLARLARVARPAMAWAHDRVVEVGVRQFERVALNGERG